MIHRFTELKILGNGGPRCLRGPIDLECLDRCRTYRCVGIVRISRRRLRSRNEIPPRIALKRGIRLVEHIEVQVNC